MDENILKQAIESNTLVPVLQSADHLNDPNVKDLHVIYRDGHYINIGSDTARRKYLFEIRRISVKKWVYYLCFDKMVEASVVLQSSCGMRDCVHPYHLKAMTMADIKKDSVLQGVELPQTKLNEGQVRDIKNKILYDNYTLAQLADEYDVSLNTIKDIKSGRTWKHIKI